MGSVWGDPCFSQSLHDRPIETLPFPQFKGNISCRNDPKWYRIWFNYTFPVLLSMESLLFRISSRSVISKVSNSGNNDEFNRNTTHSGISNIVRSHQLAGIQDQSRLKRFLLPKLLRRVWSILN